MATIQQVVNYYVARLASIYRSKSKASAQLALFAKQMLADNLASELNSAYDVEQATGAQLDTIGKYVGAPRDVGVADTRPFFGFVTADYPTDPQNLNGFVIANSLVINADGIWFQSGFIGKSTSQLSDYDYRTLLKLKIATNSSDNTMASLQEQIANFFPGQLQVVDNQDMTMQYFYGQSFQLPLSVLTASLPRPMGVGVIASKAAGFEVTVDGVPAYTSQTPLPLVAWGLIDETTAKAFVLTNVTDTPIEIQDIFAGTKFTVSSVSPDLPITLAVGESVSFYVTADIVLSGTYEEQLVVLVYAASHLSQYRTRLTAVVEVFTDSLYVDIDGFDLSPFTGLVNNLVSHAPNNISAEYFSGVGPIEITNIAVTGGVESLKSSTVPFIVYPQQGEYSGESDTISITAAGSLTLTHTGGNSPMVFNFTLGRRMALYAPEWEITYYESFQRWTNGTPSTYEIYLNTYDSGDDDIVVTSVVAVGNISLSVDAPFSLPASPLPGLGMNLILGVNSETASLTLNHTGINPPFVITFFVTEQ